MPRIWCTNPGSVKFMSVNIFFWECYDKGKKESIYKCKITINDQFFTLNTFISITDLQSQNNFKMMQTMLIFWFVQGLYKAQHYWQKLNQRWDVLNFESAAQRRMWWEENESHGLFQVGTEPMEKHICFSQKCCPPPQENYES